MKIPKKDALMWMSFFASLPDDEEILPRQQTLLYATLAQIEDAVEARFDALLSQIKHLNTLDGRTYFVGGDAKFPAGCRSCLLGTGLGAVRKTNACNANCRFCYDFGALSDIPPIGEGMWEIGGTKFRERDIDLLLSVQKKPTGVAYVYLEPFMEIEKYYPIIEKFHAAGIHQHLYTNGIAANEASLRALGEAGLDELRVNLGASHCADSVIAKIAIAKKYIGSVGVETPMIPETYASIQKKRNTLLATGLDFINCAELHLNQNNIGNYAGEPMYMYRHGYLSPVWSRELTLKLMKQADDEGWQIVVHDCANRTKFARDLNLGEKERGWFGASGYKREFDRMPYEAFLPILQDESFQFLSEEPLPVGYRPGDIVL